MSKSCKHSNPLNRQGTSQAERILQALDPANVELHGLDENDWMQFAGEYAGLINYFQDENPDHPISDWQDFFESNGETKTLLERYGDGDIEPYLALFVSFLKLLSYPQQSLNELPKRHLDFYYKQVLRLKKKPFTPDRVHVLFELAKNARQELVKKNVALKAGKDSDGNPLQYKTTNSLVVNPAKVASLKSVFVDNEGILRYAPVVNSADGQGADFESDPSWPAFGKTKDSVWPEAELGFYIASPLLHLKEGKRVVTLDFTFNDASDLEKLSSSSIEARFTGEKGWLGPLNVKFDENDKSIWHIILDSEQDSVVDYDESVHQAKIATNHPVVKISFKNHQDYKSLKKISCHSLNIFVNVQGITSLQLQNELGGLDPSKPFRPFGSRPKVGSKLSIKYPEMVGKPVTDFNLNMAWLNKPQNFIDYYADYFTNTRELSNKKNDSSISAETFNTVLPQDWVSEVRNSKNIPDLNHWQGTEDIEENINASLYHVVVIGPGVKKQKSLFNKQSQIPVNVRGNGTFKRGAIKLRLLSRSFGPKTHFPFYHEKYQELYLNAVLKAQQSEKNDNTGSNGGENGHNHSSTSSQKINLPNKPYTPLLDKLTLDYKAQQSVSFEDHPAEQSSIMFHHHPFGVRRVRSDNNERATLLPLYEYGNLFLGLENMEVGSNISLLFQVAEGTENPQHSTFEADEGPDWWVLNNNQWLPLDDDAFARNATNHFLQSGIAEVALPKEATSDNTLLKGGLHWLRIRLKKRPDAVPRFVGVHAQAAKAVFVNQGNTTNHLKDGLPAETIKKLVNPRAQLKSVMQPYASFEGRPTESDDAFYRRVSERLRHKNRAVSIWDYEHLALQQFPSLSKVKCLNHTSLNGSLDELHPGKVTLVLVPETNSSNLQDRLQPRVSQNFKDEVEQFFNGRNSMHARLRAVNPIYEPVKFNFGIHFKTGLDFNFYKKKTMTDLRILISPWLVESDDEVRFGGHFNEYEVVNYLENLEYVDFIEDFHMYHKPNNGDWTKKSIVAPSNPMAVLVPAAAKIQNITEAQHC